jgi:hypothetical protein
MASSDRTYQAGHLKQCEISSSHGKYETQEYSGMYCRVLNWMSTDVSEMRTASIIRAIIALMMEAA